MGSLMTPPLSPPACAALLVVAFILAGFAQTTWFAWTGSQAFAVTARRRADVPWETTVWRQQDTSWTDRDGACRRTGPADHRIRVLSHPSVAPGSVAADDGRLRRYGGMVRARVHAGRASKLLSQAPTRHRTRCCQHRTRSRVATGGRSSRLRHRSPSRCQPRRPRSLDDVGDRAFHRTDLPLELQRPDVPPWHQTQAGVRDMSTDLLSVDSAPATSPCSFVVPLGEACDVAECGNKAANLARLLNLGVPVPPGIVVTNAALEAFLDEGALRGPIAELCRDLRSKSSVDLANVADAIHALIVAASAMSPAARGDRRSGASTRTRTVHRTQLRAGRGLRRVVVRRTARLDRRRPRGSVDRSPREGLGVAVVASRDRLWNRQGRGPRWNGRRDPAPGGLTVVRRPLLEGARRPYADARGVLQRDGRRPRVRPQQSWTAHDRTGRLSIRPRGRAGGLPLTSRVARQRARSLRPPIDSPRDRGSLRSTAGHRVDDRCRRPALDRPVSPDHGSRETPDRRRERRAHVVS